MDDCTFWDNVAVTLMPLNGVGANARHISDEPLCAFVLTTSVQTRPPPEMLLTVVLEPVK
jgi:hypothetical protein